MGVDFDRVYHEATGTRLDPRLVIEIVTGN